MKKLFFVMILAFIWLNSFGQKHPPIAPYNESGYTLDQFKDFALTDDTYHNNFYESMIDIINAGLEQSGRYKKLAEFPITAGRHDVWIWSHIHIKDGVILNNGFINSYKNGNQVTPFWDKEKFRGSCFVLDYDDCEIILAKTICMNLIKGQIEFSPVIQEQVAETKIPEDRHYTVANPQVFKEDRYVPATVINTQIPTEKTPKKEIKLFWKVVVPVAAMVGIAAYMLRPRTRTVYVPAPDTGGPAGAPGYPADTGTGTGNTGGPAGSPGYGN